MCLASGVPPRARCEFWYLVWKRHSKRESNDDTSPQGHTSSVMLYWKLSTNNDTAKPYSQGSDSIKIIQGTERCKCTFTRHLLYERLSSLVRENSSLVWMGFLGVPPKNREIALWPNTRVVKCKYYVLQKLMGSIIRFSGTVFYSFSYLDSRPGFNGLKYL